MRLAYIDESGDGAPISAPPAPNDQPVLVLGALFIDSMNLHAFTLDFMDLKYKYFPGLPYSHDGNLSRILPEIKGAEIRQHVLRGSARQQHHAIGLLDRLMGLLQKHDVRMAARIWIKSVGGPFNDTPVYTSSMQSLCQTFDHYLSANSDNGYCIADSRTKGKNATVAHSIFTKKFSWRREYPRIVELPTFAHSDNHAGLQVCDLVCSALLFPIASFVYCTGHVSNIHVQPKADTLRRRYGTTLKSLQYRYQDSASKWHGGLSVADAIAKRSGSAMFA